MSKVKNREEHKETEWGIANITEPIQTVIGDEVRY
jgi:hypothetical protein